MKRLLYDRLLPSLLLAALLLPVPAAAQQESDFDHWQWNRDMIQHGVQAILMCNGLFTSHRTLDQVFEQELAYLSDPIGTPEGGDYVVDRERRAVAVGGNGGPGDAPTIRAAFREGIGCVVMPPDQTFADIDALPEIDLPPPAGDPDTIPWPMGDLVADEPLADGIDGAALQAASDWAFDRESPYQVTVSLLVIHDGEIVHERYAPGFDRSTRTRTWSTAKSIAVTLMGILADRGEMALDEPLPFDWIPRTRSDAPDPREEITLRDVLNMSSGLETVDNGGMEYATGSGLAYWAGASSAVGARDRGLIHEPGTYWDYENYDTLLGVLAMKTALGDPQTYLEFPRRALLDRLGMRNTLLSTDRFGDFILSSQVYTNARDLGRFGMLYLNDGVWQGERIISEAWIDFVRTPAPSTAERGGFYGGQWWLVPEGTEGIPSDAYSTAGNRGQYAIVVPSHDVVIVRRGLDWGRQGFSRWELTREVLKAFEPVEDR